MSESKKSRTLEEIQREYTVILQRAGYLQYQQFVTEKDLAMVNESLRNLNLEANEVQTAQAAAKAKEEAAKAVAAKGETSV